MCGFVGMIGNGNIGLLNEALNRIGHRGPDGRDVYCDSDNLVYLGHNRLSIVDLTHLSAQPFVSICGKYIIVYNGEVYNYKEIRNQLISSGVSFKSEGDTEVVLNQYIQEGAEGFKKLNGMFSCCIYDKSRNSIVLVRDRYGIKPLYYSNVESFMFSSEIKGILPFMNSHLTINDELMNDYIVYGHLEHTDETFFKGINKVPPGNVLTYNIREGIIKITKYGTLEISQDISRLSFGESKDIFEQLLIQSIESKIPSEVAYASLLSGGLDSSAIVSIVSKLFPNERLNTFSLCSEELKFDETKYIEILKKKYSIGTNYQLSETMNIWDDLERIIDIQEEPFSSPSVYAQYKLLETVKEHGYKVVFDGQGADEILGGYRKYKLMAAKNFYKEKKFVSMFTELLGGTLQFGGVNSFKRDWMKILRLIGRDNNFTYLNYLNPNIVKQTYNKSHNTYHSMMMDDLTKYSLPLLLKYADKNGMSNSIEGRFPFLDNQVVDFSMQLPVAYKNCYGRSKLIMREALKEYLPEQIRNRKDKMGFVINEPLWMSNGTEFIYEAIWGTESKTLEKYYNLSLIRKNYNNIINGKMDIYLWRLVNIYYWIKIYNLKVV